MHDIHVAITVLVLVGVLITLPRALKGPTLMDRILAVNVIGTKTIVLLALVGFLQVELGIDRGAPADDFSRAGFWLDIALAYSLINFIATIAVLKYLERRAVRHETGATKETP
ncbi:MAG: monovalent cation/H+ antiporter complex subunit F [Planctomycetota bacterium]|nr:monovalent cation/H+ antiporter complex subunit F [Planctomycetota bacterium]